MKISIIEFSSDSVFNVNVAGLMNVPFSVSRYFNSAVILVKDNEGFNGLDTVAHEMVHAVQYDLCNRVFSHEYLFLVEGLASYLSHQIAGEIIQKHDQQSSQQSPWSPAEYLKYELGDQVVHAEIMAVLQKWKGFRSEEGFGLGQAELAACLDEMNITEKVLDLDYIIGFLAIMRAVEKAGSDVLKALVRGDGSVFKLA